jgi:glycosyltransferase involved in cell wall biosynthesis
VMPKVPAIAIITPSFNRAWSIRTCIQSLQRQSFTEYEHIIVDGGSTDETLGILQDVAASDSRVTYRSEPDSGMYDAVNKGMRMATAEIVAYLNTDDFYLPRTLERIVQLFTERPDLSIIYGHWLSWHPETTFLEPLPVLNYSAMDQVVFAVLPQPSVFFRRKVFDTLGGFDLSFKLLADNDFFSKSAVAGFKSARIDDYLSVQTVHAGNLLAGNPAAVLQSKQEGERYRHARQQEITQKKPDLPFGLQLAASHLKKLALPVSWRMILLFRLIRSEEGTAEQRLSLPVSMTRSLSKSTLLHYLLGRGGRHIHAFFKIDSSAFAAYLGIVLPGCIPSSNTDGGQS